MWDHIIIFPFFGNTIIVSLSCSVFFIRIDSLWVEFEVGVNAAAPTKGAAREEGALGIGC